MSSMNNNEMFTEVTAEESATVSGGVFTGGFSLDLYLFGLGAALQFGNPGVTADEVQKVWENSVFGADPTRLALNLPTFN
jgi:hypothetical protein